MALRDELGTVIEYAPPAVKKKDDKPQPVVYNPPPAGGEESAGRNWSWLANQAQPVQQRYPVTPYGYGFDDYMSYQRQAGILQDQVTPFNWGYTQNTLGGRGDAGYATYNQDYARQARGLQQPKPQVEKPGNLGTPVQDPYRDSWRDQAGIGKMQGVRDRYGNPNNLEALTTRKAKEGYFWDGSAWVRRVVNNTSAQRAWWNYGGGGGGWGGVRSRLPSWYAQMVQWRI